MADDAATIYDTTNVSGESFKSLMWAVLNGTDQIMPFHAYQLEGETGAAKNTAFGRFRIQLTLHPTVSKAEAGVLPLFPRVASCLLDESAVTHRQTCTLLHSIEP